jgi:tetratricopeptide (TPR) repeat protein
MRWLFLCVVLLVSAPAWAQDRQTLSGLLDALADAPDEAAAAGLETRILRAWEQAGGPMVAMLLQRSSTEIAHDDADEALADIDAAQVLAPDTLEIMHHRALARYHKGDVAGAYHDLEDVLRREPRHFAAWRSLSEIAEAQGNLKAAYAAWQKLVALDPKTKGGSEHLEELRRRVEGEKS